MLSLGKRRLTERRSEKMWEIILGFALEKVFGAHTSAFEIGGEYVQTSVPGAAAPQAIGKATVEPSIDSITYPSLVRVANNSRPSRHYVQVGFNPFGPVLQKGAEDLLKLTGHSNKRYD